MPHYDYQFTDTGAVIEVFQSMRDEPLAEIDGRSVKRVISSPQLMGLDTGRRRDKYPYVSNALPTTIQGTKMVRQKRRDGTWSRKKPLIESAKHEREVMARNDLVRSED